MVFYCAFRYTVVVFRLWTATLIVGVLRDVFENRKRLDTFCVFKLNGSTMQAETFFALALFGNETSCLYYFANDRSFCSHRFRRFEAFRALPTIQPDRLAIALVENRFCAFVAFHVVKQVCEPLIGHFVLGARLFDWLPRTLAPLGKFRSALEVVARVDILSPYPSTIWLRQCMPEIRRLLMGIQ